LDGETPLYMAASGGHPEVIRLLLAGGAQIGAANKNGETPLHLTARRVQLEVVSLLLAGGAQTEAVDKVRRMSER